MSRSEIYRVVTWVVTGVFLCLLLPSVFFPEHHLVLQMVLTAVVMLGFVFWFRSWHTAVPAFKKNVQEMEALNRTQGIMLELSNSVMSIQDTDALLRLILLKAIEVVPAARFGTILVMNDEGKLEFKANEGFDEALIDIKFSPSETFQWQATGGNFVEPIILSNVINHGRRHMEPDTFDRLKDMGALNPKDSLSAPILINGEFYGSINIDSNDSGAFTERDRVLMQFFANQVGVVISNHQLFEQSRYLARFDSLTGIYNRRYFDELFAAYLKADEGQRRYVLAIIDMDGLKQCNDNYGHRCGDILIRHFAQALSESVRDNDIVARYGGDEFIAVFVDCTIPIVHMRMGEIRERLDNDPICIGSSCIRADFSYGLSVYPDDATDYEGLVRIADSRMYEQKRAHQNQPI